MLIEIPDVDTTIKSIIELPKKAVITNKQVNLNPNNKTRVIFRRNCSCYGYGKSLRFNKGQIVLLEDYLLKPLGCFLQIM